jgi:hypothetical protein
LFFILGMGVGSEHSLQQLKTEVPKDPGTKTAQDRSRPIIPIGWLLLSLDDELQH